MGSKSHDIYSLQITPICNQDTDLFKKNLVQFSVYSKKGTDIFKGLLKNSQRPINLKIFEKLGFTAKVNMTQEMLTDEAVFNFIKNQVDDTITKVTDWFFFPYNYLNVVDQLKNNESLTLDYTDTETFTFTVNGNTETIELPSIKYGNKTYYIMKKKSEKDESEIPAVVSEVSEDNVNETDYYIMLSKEKDAFYSEDGETHIYPEKIEYNPDKRVSIRIKYLDNKNEEHIWNGFDNIIREAKTTQVLGIVVKNNGIIQQEDKKMHVALSNVGIKYEDITDSLNSDTLKTFIITYATKDKNYHYFSKYLNALYRENNNITIDIEGNSFTYAISTIQRHGTIRSSYSLKIKASDGGSTSYTEEDEEFFYFIPLNWVKELNVHERYEFIKECLVLLAYSHDVVHTSFFESGFFRFVVTVVASIATGNPALVIGMSIAGNIIASSNLSPELKMALTVAMSVAVSSYSNPNTNTLSFENIANFSVELAKYYFKKETQDIVVSIQELEQEREEIAETINSIKKQTIYIPMEQIGSYYDLQYSLLYDFNDLYYNTVNESTINDKNLI